MTPSDALSTADALQWWHRPQRCPCGGPVARGITMNGDRFIVQCGKCKAKVIGGSHEEAVAMWLEVNTQGEHT